MKRTGFAAAATLLAGAVPALWSLPAEGQSARFCATERAVGRYPPGCPDPVAQPSASPPARPQARPRRQARHSTGPAATPRTEATAARPLSPAEIQRRWFETINVGDIRQIAAMLDSGMVTIGTMIDNDSNTALHLAAERCDDAVARYLLSRGARPDRPNGYRDTPLRIAQVRCGPGSRVVAVLAGGR